MPKRAILHIPHPEMLAHQSVRYWIDRFEHVARTRPMEVVLPAVGFQGPAFQSRVSAIPAGLKQGNLLPDWIRQVREALGNGVAVWASIMPTFGFLEVETLMLMDQYGMRFDSQACISTPAVQKTTEIILSEMADFGLSGVVFDLSDIYPNSGSNVIAKQIQNTCFCFHCLRQLELFDWKQRQRPFLGRGNISRLVLRLTGTGADHINARHQWIRDLDAASLLQMSEARGFIDDGGAATADAELLLKYLGARAKVTAASVRALGAPARAKNLAVAVILENEYFDMTTCTDIATLVAQEAASEYWLPAVDIEFVQSKGITALQYLSARGPYALNAFFEKIGKADLIIASGGVQALIGQLLRTSKSMLHASRLTSGGVFAVELADEYAGLVGVPMGRDDAVTYIEGLTAGTLGQVVPRAILDQILDQVKLGSPEIDVPESD